MIESAHPQRPASGPGAVIIRAMGRGHRATHVGARLWRGLSRRSRDAWARLARRMATRRLHGPARITLSPTEVMAVLLVRDGAWFVPRFLDHHLTLGAAHVLVIDNGSTDETVALCRRPKVTVLRNTMPARLNESALRAELARRVARGGWLLFADADELVELPLAGPRALARLTGYCNARGFTAVLGQMLDHFAEGMETPPGASYDECIAAMRFHSLDRIETIPYFDRARVGFSWFLRHNRCEDPGVRLHRGGLRAEIFGEDPFLTKHSLVRNLRGVQPMVHPHAAAGVSVADVTLLLHHYKLAGDWVARDRAGLAAHHWDHGEDARRLEAAEGPAPIARPRHPRPWRGVEDLLAEGFLHASPAFRAATADAGLRSAAPPAGAEARPSARPPGG